MDSNKENRSEDKTKSKIPLPIQPLPSLPKKLLQKNDMRCPLKNINHITTSNINKASKVTETNKKCRLKIDSKHVTVRKTEDLDWDYKVFKDEKVITSSTTTDAGPSENEKKLIGNHKHCHEVTKTITPFKSPCLAVNRIKNIKRSLKRPHSRELQGISPMTKENKAEGTFRRRLDFQGVEDKLQLPDVLNKTYMTCLTQDYTTDMFAYLLEIEKKNAKPHIKSIHRACVLNWLMKISGTNGNPVVIQTAQWYLDSLLSRSHIHIEFLQLVTAACYWISQKSYGPVITARRLVRCSSHAFTVGKLVSVEKSVLATLKFPTIPVVPQDFIAYLSWCCDSSKPGEIEVAATFLCMSALMTDKTLCNEYPSVIGAAAVRNAVLLLGEKNLLAKLQNNTVYRAAKAKACNFSAVCSAQRKAVCIISSPLCKYKAPLEQYGTAPHFIAQRIINAANEIQQMQYNTA